jgi:hypothetical protein
MTSEIINYEYINKFIHGDIIYIIKEVIVLDANLLKCS